VGMGSSGLEFAKRGWHKWLTEAMAAPGKKPYHRGHRGYRGITAKIICNTT